MVKKSRKIEEDQKSLVSIFAKFNFWNEEWALGYVSTKI